MANFTIFIQFFGNKSSSLGTTIEEERKFTILLLLSTCLFLSIELFDETFEHVKSVLKSVSFLKK